MTVFGSASTSSSQSDTSLALEYDCDMAARLFATHFEKTGCPNSTVEYTGDFMRKVATVRITKAVECSATFSIEASVIQSSSAIEAGARLANAALKLTYALEEVGRPREAAREVMRVIEDHLHVTNLSVANNILTDAEVQKLSSRSLIGLIRSSSRARQVLPAWDSAYQKSWKEVKRKNKNPEALFVGLPRPKEI